MSFYILMKPYLTHKSHNTTNRSHINDISHNCMPALFQIVARRRSDKMTWSEPKGSLCYWGIYAPLGLNEVTYIFTPDITEIFTSLKWLSYFLVLVLLCLDRSFTVSFQYSFSLYNESRRLPIWWLCRRWWHRELLLRQLAVPPVTQV